MSVGEIVLLVMGVLVLIALIVVPLVLALTRRARRRREELTAELAGEGLVLGPESALYRGGSGSYPRVAGNGTIALSQRRLVFRILVGTSLELPVDAITGVREAKVFKRSVVGGKVHVVVATAAGEVAFFVNDNAAWIAALTGAAPRLRVEAGG